MNNNSIIIVKLIGFIIVFCAIITFPVFASDQKKHDHENHHKEHHNDAHHEKNHEEHHHKALHGGCLNVIEKCEIAHIEVKVEDSAMKCWFVGGGNDTDKSVRIPEEKIILSVKFSNNKENKLVLKARPIELAEEKIGECSFFEGKADWLSSLKEFKAYGKAMVKGKIRDIKIHYPEGYDPDHEHDHVHEHTERK